MSMLYDDLKSALPPGMSVPEPFRLLYDWIEEQGFIEGEVGMLFLLEELKAGWTETERPGGTHIEFSAKEYDDLQHWLGDKRPEVLNRLCVFARTGAEGSTAAFWIDDAGKQVIVHMGSGSGSTLCCVLADDAIDFLRLLAIGYDEICWDEAFAEPPSANPDITVHPNVAYQQWVMQTFNVTIPTTALEIVKIPDSMNTKNPTDRFCRWLRQVQQ